MGERLLGASWHNHNARNVRAAYRNNKHPDNRNDNNGSRPGWRPSTPSLEPESRLPRNPGVCLRESRSITLVKPVKGQTEERRAPPVTRNLSSCG